MKKIFTKFNILIFILTPVLFLIDIITKIVTDGKTVVIIKNFFSFESIHNFGAAFSILSGAKWFFITLTAIVLVVFIIFHIKNKEQNFVYATAFAFIFAGTFGNFIDRIFLGYVRDFIKFDFFPAIFNFADICLTVGVILFIVYLLFFVKSKDKVEEIIDIEKSGK